MSFALFAIKSQDSSSQQNRYLPAQFNPISPKKGPILNSQFPTHNSLTVYSQKYPNFTSLSAFETQLSQSESSNTQSESLKTQSECKKKPSEDRKTQSEDPNTQSESVNTQSEDAKTQSESQKTQFESRNTQSEDPNMQSESRKRQFERKNRQSEDLGSFLTNNSSPFTIIFPSKTNKKSIKTIAALMLYYLNIL
jgi:hypothetical protein